MKKKILSMLVLLMAVVTGAWAQTQWTSGDCTVTLSGDVMTVSGTGAMADYADSYELPWYGYNYDTKTIVIESGVTSIGNSAFAKCSNLESVSIPASVTSIGSQAFEDCGSDVEAMTVSFAEGSTPLTIGEGAFGYANLKSIDIPNRVTSIGNGAFTSCSKLESVSIPASVTSIGNFAFQSCGSYAEALTVSFAEGSTLESIGESTFLEAKLTSINIPNSVTSIGTFAFSGCSNLESVSIPASVTSIGYNAFSSCSKLESVSIPASVTSISEGAFRYCGMLAKVYIYAPSLTTYGANAFASNATGRKIYVPADAVDTYKAGWSAYAADIEAMTLTLYATSVKEGTQDADKWTITPNPAAEGQTVTATYSGTKRVKSVKAVKKEVIPVGAIKGKFTINNTGKQVYFAKGNLQAVCTSADNNPSSPETFTWQFAENQWDCVGNNAANNSIDGNGSVSAAGTVDLFGWSTAATTYGIHNSTTASDYSGDFVDWGGIIGTGWRTLTNDEWNYLFMTRESGSKVNGMSPSPDNARYTHATINTDNGNGGIRGMILFPDGVTVNYSDATSWGGINQYSNWNGSTKCTTSQWNALAAKGFVFLPAGGVRNGTKISNSNNNGYYWSSYTASPTSGSAHYTRVVASTEPTTDYDSRKIGISVRLVYDVE